MSAREDMDYNLRIRGFDPDECRRQAHLDKTFGEGTYAIVERLREEQDCKCAICQQPETVAQYGIVKHLMLDHCHSTGKIRGLICTRCNHALGHFKDDPKLLRAAAQYLRNSHAKEASSLPTAS